MTLQNKGVTGSVTGGPVTGAEYFPAILETCEIPRQARDDIYFAQGMTFILCGRTFTVRSVRGMTLLYAHRGVLHPDVSARLT
ncbi:hypothetical protein MNBD_NITROSPINAE03-810 [hydrothermal vent metagenome]|uniref:Uncharacterized protein n=1 Tax=hydrothermal vent metagenome TaxID=652676 RepID=A0A3B1CD94_9ZZZZ